MRKKNEKIEEINEKLEKSEEIVSKNAEEASKTDEDIESKLKKELDEALLKQEEYLGIAQRIQADFENFKRRNAEVRRDSYEDGAGEVIKMLLPVIDNFERALHAESSNGSIKEGVQLIYNQLMEIFEKRGVTVIDRKGEKFDPNLEDAIVQGNPEEGEPGTVCEVFLKGYKFKNTILRHAMVKVVAEQ